MKPLGVSSHHWRIVALAYSFRVPPHVLEDYSPRMLWTMERFLEHLNTEREKAQRSRRR